MAHKLRKKLPLPLAGGENARLLARRLPWTGRGCFNAYEVRPKVPTHISLQMRNRT